MSLNYVSVSLGMKTVYDQLKNDLIQDNPNQTPYPKAPLTQWMDTFKTVYDNDANNGVFTQPSVVMAPMPNLLAFDNTGSTCSGPTMMAQKIADYWAAQVTPGSPIYAGIISVSNDAAKIAPIIQSYLCGCTSISSTPAYEHLFQFIETQVKTIEWKVTEFLGAGTSTYSVFIT